MSTEPIREATLRELLGTESVSAVYAVGQAGGFTVAVRCGVRQRVLGSTRGSVRVFSNLTSVATFLKALGVSVFQVDAAHYTPGRIRSARPDRAEALKRTRTKPKQTDFLM